MSEQTHKEQYRRQRHFVDKHVQGRLLWGLVILEILLFACGMLVVYLDMQGTLEENLYRVHQSAGGRPLLFRELWITIPWIILINVNLMIIVDRIWKRDVKLIVTQLAHILERVKKLDLRSYTVTADQHEVLHQADKWFAIERERYHAIQTEINSLPNQVDKAAGTGINQLRNQLASLRELLPHT